MKCCGSFLSPRHVFAEQHLFIYLTTCDGFDVRLNQFVRISSSDKIFQMLITETVNSRFDN